MEVGQLRALAEPRRHLLGGFEQRVDPGDLDLDLGLADLVPTRSTLANSTRYML
jgi:hypothetical protein